MRLSAGVAKAHWKKKLFWRAVSLENEKKQNKNPDLLSPTQRHKVALYRHAGEPLKNTGFAKATF
ncbi:hypothetical protein N473_19325 [Pseudoalteromonas luteoviolacea CPMOR-1]|uniref:Uncharacterized protein n=1 Tax=Pseudoalteromonas luteoviolacea CPMOR-1 TaxID=1365248 RepID=A0A161YLQ7_9GAMM|nr:hypothetical protein N473_19325 [Pseudoalteromonas luteoviolacea CPMOR-1]